MGNYDKHQADVNAFTYTDGNGITHADGNGITHFKSTMCWQDIFGWSKCQEIMSVRGEPKLCFFSLLRLRSIPTLAKHNLQHFAFWLFLAVEGIAEHFTLKLRCLSRQIPMSPIVWVIHKGLTMGIHPDTSDDYSKTEVQGLRLGSHGGLTTTNIQITFLSYVEVNVDRVFKQCWHKSRHFLLNMCSYLYLLHGLKYKVLLR